MNNEQVIMDQLDHLGQEIASLTDSARSLRELRDDLSPRVNETVKVLIEELAEIEADVQFEDLVSLLKNLMRNVRNLTWSVDQLKNLIDFIRTVEPLLKSVVPQAILYLDKLEQQGVFQVFASMMGVLEKIADTYTPEDIEQIGQCSGSSGRCGQETDDTGGIEPFGQSCGSAGQSGSFSSQSGGPLRYAVCLGQQ